MSRKLFAISDLYRMAWGQIFAFGVYMLRLIFSAVCTRVRRVSAWYSFHKHQKQRSDPYLGIVLSLLLLLVLVNLGVWAQESILTFSIEPAAVTLSPGGEAGIRVEVDNSSTHEADDVTVTLEEADGWSIRSETGVLKVVRPFTQEWIDLTLAASSDLPPGQYTLLLQVIYTFCIDVSCFQIVDEILLTVVVEEGAFSVPTPPPAKRSSPGWIPPLIAGGLLVGALLLWRTRGMTFPLYFVLFVIVAGALTYGVRLNQHEQAQGIAAVLCTSCVGIEESHHEEPTLSSSAIDALAKLDRKIELIVFYAPWCHSCPYTEAMVEKMAAQTPYISYKFIDVDAERDLAATYGVIRSSRTIVPAVLRVDTDELIFGVEDLEERLLNLLEVGS
jgi:thiol-disulfide isomerase/thioredoxin